VPIAVAEISVVASWKDPASLIPTVREFKFATCGAALVVIPVAMDTAHCTPAGSLAEATVRCNVAILVVELTATAVNVVEPQPLVLGVDSVANVKLGIVRAIASPIARS
jgi:hypothetical protein